MCKFESKERGRRGTMWQFESKEVCKSLCFHSKSEYTGGRKLVVWDGPRAATAPQPPRTPRLTPLAFAPPCTPIYCENTGICTLPYFQTATLPHACHVPYFQTCTLSHTCHVSELFKCELPLAYLRLHHICISIILRKAILPCFPQFFCAHQNFKEKLCPELDGPRAATAPQPPRTPRLTPLAFAPPCTPIYCENTGIRTLPYFQTATLSHTCHVSELFKCELPLGCSTTGLSHCELPLDYSTTWLSYCELPLDYSTTCLSYCELPLDYSTTWLRYHLTELLWATSWLLYHLTTLSNCS